jgi:DNA-binding MarR family transcriptional regulator
MSAETWEEADAMWEDLLTCRQLLRRELVRVLDAHGMLLSEFRALRVLASGPAPMGRVGAQLGLSPATLTSLARGLRRHGWARSTTSPQDRRSSLLQATPQGRRVLRRAQQDLRRARRDYGLRLVGLEGALAPSERRKLSEGLRALRTALESLSEPSPGPGDRT